MQETMTAPPLQGMANLLEDQGRYGDTELVHMSQPEVKGLQSLGRLTRNPETGLMEAFSIGGFFKDYVAPAALFAVPYVGPYLSAGYTGIKAGLESGNVLTGITSGLLSYGLGKVGQNLFKGAFGADKAISPGAKSFTSSLEKGATGAKALQQTGGVNFGQAPISGQNIQSALDVANTGIQNVPISARITPAFSNAAASVPESGFKQLVKTAAMPGGMRQLGGEFMKNLATPETAIRGLASGVISDLTRTPEYAEATGFATDDSAREPVLADNKNFAMNTRTAPLSASQILASQMGQPIRYTDPKYSIANTGNISDTLTYAKKGGMLDALDSITEGMEELAEQTDGDVSIEGMIKAAAEGGMMDDVKVNPMSNLQQIAMGQQRPFEGRVMGQGDGMSDEIPFSIEGQQPALLSRDEYVLPADVVSALGNGSSNAGADKLDGFLTDVRKKVMGRERQINEIG
jgi:hypothetical protein